MSNTLAIISLKLVIWSFSLPVRMLSCLTNRSTFSLVICFLMSSSIPFPYSGSSWISSSLRFSHSMHSCNSTFFAFFSTFSEPLMLLSCLSRPRSSCMGKSSEDSPSSCAMGSSVVFAAFSVISWSILCNLMELIIKCRRHLFFQSVQHDSLLSHYFTPMSKPNLQCLFFVNIQAISLADFSILSLVVKGMFMSW